MEEVIEAGMDREAGRQSVVVAVAVGDGGGPLNGGLGTKKRSSLFPNLLGKR